MEVGIEKRNWNLIHRNWQPLPQIAIHHFKVNKIILFDITNSFLIWNLILFSLLNNPTFSNHTPDNINNNTNINYQKEIQIFFVIILVILVATYEHKKFLFLV